jgi:para-aminobenzoate synthetase component 1
VAACAHLGGRLATGLVTVSDDPAVLDTEGWWAVVVTYEGDVTCARFVDIRESPLPDVAWVGVDDDWSTSLGRAAYIKAVEQIRERIARGDVYQANLCRRMSARCDGDLRGLARVLAEGNPAPYSGFVLVEGLEVVTASPELFLRRTAGVVESSPIKGTGRTAADLLPKDEAENVMIVDLVRNDLGRVCATGSVEVASLLELEEHPGLVHLVSTVRGRLRDDVGWPQLLEATFPPGSVTGAPKSSALRILRELEPTPRGPYCGAIGWVDATTRTAELAVGIRTFWRSEGRLHFGTGAGITWGSEAAREWDETELKAAHLLALASKGSL